MAKDLTLGNGTLLLNFDGCGQLRDLYFPHVGLENHLGGHLAHRIGVYADDRLSWLATPAWRVDISLAADAFIGQLEAVNDELKVKLVFADAVYNEKNIFIRKVTVKNLAPQPRTLKAFFYQQFEPYESHVAHTAYFEPTTQAIIHYRNQRTFLISGQSEGRRFDDYSTGVFQSGDLEGTYRDAEDGLLAKNPIEHGQVDSIIAFSDDFAAEEEKTIYYWLAVGFSLTEVLDLNKYVLEKGPAHLQETTRNFWKAWVNRRNFLFYGLSQDVINLCKRSLFLLRAHVDWGGGIIASGDSASLQYGKDTYAYVWPRDAAMAALALTLAGDQQLARSFFNFCNDTISPDGYFMHKYSPDKAVGSSWHPFVKNGQPQLPIQEDATALVLWSLWHYYAFSKDLEFVESVYNSLIKKAADFMVLFRDRTTGLPRPSYDLWEEKFGISTFTAASVYGALTAASRFSGLLGKVKHEETYRGAAEEVRAAILRYLYDDRAGYFYKLIELSLDELRVDTTVDSSSVYGVFNFGVLPPQEERVRRAIARTEAALRLKTAVGGIARYDGDRYYRLSADYPGNPWFITTLWLAQYWADTAKSEAELQPVKECLEWMSRYAKSSGILSEQLHPFTGEQLSVAPLTWSHAEFVIAVIKYLDKLEALGVCPASNPVNA